MTELYREQLLERLEDGEWHTAAELAHPTFPSQGLAAFVAILRAAGYGIEEEGAGGLLRYRLVARP